MNFKRAVPYGVEIAPSDNGGFYVRVGCTNMVYSESEVAKLVGDLKAYLQDPKVAVDAYNASSSTRPYGPQDLSRPEARRVEPATR